MRDHEAGIRPGSRTRNGGSPLKLGIDQQRDAAFGQSRRFRGGEREDVGGEGDRLRVEIAARKNFAGIRQDQRIVGDGVRFDRKRAAAMAHLVEAPRPSPAAGSATNTDPARLSQSGC